MRFIIIAALVSIAAPAHAQLAVAERSVFVASAFPGFSDLSIDGSDRLEASIRIENKGAKVTYAPFVLSGTYREVLSETRFQLSQEEGRTRLGVSMAYNPYSPRGGAGSDLWQASEASSKRTATLNRLNAYHAALRRLQDVYWRDLRTELNEITDLETQRDMNPADATLPPRIRNLRKQLEEKKLALERTRLADPTNPASLTDVLAQMGAIRARISSIETEIEAAGAAEVRAFARALFAPGPPAVTLSYSAAVFSRVGGDAVDADADGLDDFGQTFQGHSLALSLDWRFSERSQLSGLLSAREERASAEAMSPMDGYLSFGLSFGQVIALLDAQYEKTKDFKESLFIPSVVLGVTVEGSICQVDNNLGCGARLVTDEFSVTPFFDFKLRKSSQFRLGVPIKTVTTAAATGSTELGITTQIAIQLGGS